MSVVNQMLQDLEKRQGEQSSSANYQPPKSSSGVSLRVVIWGVMILVCVAAGAYWLMLGETNRDAKQNHRTVIVPINQQQPTQADVLTENVDDIEADGTVFDDEDDPTPSSISTVSSDSAPVDLDESDTTTQSNEATELGTQTQPAKDDMATVIPAEPSVLTISKPNQGEPQLGLIQRARRAASQGNTAEAIALFQTLIQREPENIEGYKSLAALYFGQGNVASAQQVLERAINDVDGEDDALRLMLARLFSRRGDTQAALAVLKAQPVPESDDLLAQRASLSQSADDLEQAIKDYQQLTTRQPNVAKWWLGLAVSADKKGQLDLSQHAYNEAISLGQLDGEVMNFMRQRLVVLGEKAQEEVQP